MGDKNPAKQKLECKELTTSTTQISILFRPLLFTITECLQLPQTKYNILDLALHKVSITVRSISGAIDGVYVGGPSTTNEDAFEQASQQAVYHLKDIYDIYVKDVTALRNQEAERCTNLWRLKRQELERMVKGLPKIDSPEEFASPEISHLHVVTIDFVSALNTVQRKIHIHCSALEVVEHTPATFTAWATITHHNNTYGCTFIYGDTSGSHETAKQNLAAKVISYLTPIYNIEIIDANHGQTQFNMNALICNMTKEKCMLLKRSIMPPDRKAQTRNPAATITSPMTPAKLTVRARQHKKTTASQIKGNRAPTSATDTGTEMPSFT